MILLSTAYFPNIQYFSKLLQSTEEVRVEAHENFQKQSYRNRCTIMGGGGPITLTIPIEGGHSQKCPIRDIRIDYSQPWRRTHARAIRSAYGSAPYMEHIEDVIMPLTELSHRFLFDLNCEITERLCAILGAKSAKLILTQEYEASSRVGVQDFRLSISPKARLQTPHSDFTPPQYYQTFAHQIPFAPNLSILDLMFCDLPLAKTLVR